VGEFIVMNAAILRAAYARFRKSSRCGDFGQSVSNGWTISRDGVDMRFQVLKQIKSSSYCASRSGRFKL